jgi:ferredoxin
MLTEYGYKDSSGEYFITINADECNGCGDCVPACPSKIFCVVEDTPIDPVRVVPLAIVDEEKCATLNNECHRCKPAPGQRLLLPCVLACKAEAISHSW